MIDLNTPIDLTTPPAAQKPSAMRRLNFPKPLKLEEESKTSAAAESALPSKSLDIDSPPSLRGKRKAKVLDGTEPTSPMSPVLAECFKSLQDDSPKRQRTEGEFSPPASSSSASGMSLDAPFLPGNAQAFLAGQEELKVSKSKPKDLPKIQPPVIETTDLVAFKVNECVCGMIKMNGQRDKKIEGEQYTLEKITDGDLHAVYGFKNHQSLQIKDTLIKDVTNIVLKCPTNDPKHYKVHGEAPLLPHKLRKIKASIHSQCARTIQAYEYLQKSGIPLPKVYLMPWNPTDLFNLTDGNFWLIERTQPHQAERWGDADVNFLELIKAGPDCKLALFVKEHLTKAANLALSDNKEHINDFYPRNIMFNSEGDPCVVDFSMPSKKVEYHELFGFLLAWSFGKQEIWDYFIQDFPKEIAAKMENLLKIEKGSRKGFPNSVKSKTGWKKEESI